MYVIDAFVSLKLMLPLLFNTFKRQEDIYKVSDNKLMALVNPFLAVL